MPTVGLFPESRRGNSFPLTSSVCHYRLIDVQVLANLVQDYLSDSNEDENVSYAFPLPPDAGVCSFKAIIDGERAIHGVVKEKELAKMEYKEAVAKGKPAGLLEKQHADVFQVSLGNIKPGQKIAVHISFISIINHDASSPDSLRLMIPVNIAPRYGVTPLSDLSSTSSAMTNLSVTVSVQMTGNITSITSPTHPISLNLGRSDPTSIQTSHDPKLAHISLESSSFLETDIIIVLGVQGLDRPRCTIEADEKAGTDAYSLTFVPRFNLPALARQDYIFLIDRSGSMEGGRISAVRTALQIMLRSLPTRGTTFNIWSFGTNHTSLWPSSQQYSSQTVAAATAHVDTLKADYGGTEIAGALRGVFDNIAERSTDEPVPTTVIVLTDGEAWQLDDVFACVKGAVEKMAQGDSFLRTFVLGVGNDVSKPMCEGVARAGNGIAVYVAENERPEVKLMNLLKAARGGVIRDLKIDWGVSEMEVDAKDAEIANEDDEDFELVPSQPEDSSKTDHRLEPEPAINLFDESAPDQNADTPLGISDATIVLPSPPRIQQAPDLNNLSIPLYPSFRTSIFAMIKRDVPSSSTVTITGTILGKDVSLSIPITTASPLTVEGTGSFLHVLAARALIQGLEDQAESSKRNAQIVHLGTTYSLASSQTSFIAVDAWSTDSEEHSEERSSGRTLDRRRAEIEVKRQRLVELRARRSARRVIPNDAVLNDLASVSIEYLEEHELSAGSTLDRRRAEIERKRQLLRSAKGACEARKIQSQHTFASVQVKSLADVDLPASVQVQFSGFSYNPGSPMGAPPDSLASEHSSTASSASSVDSPARSTSSDATAVSSRSPPRLIQVSSIRPSNSPPRLVRIGSPIDSSPGPLIQISLNVAASSSRQRSHSPALVPDSIARDPLGPPTLEKIARAASFDGSFHPSALDGALPVIPPIPQSMSSLPTTATVSVTHVIVPIPVTEIAWCTILVVAYLTKHFMDQRDAWEVLEEKALDFVRGILNEVGAIEQTAVEELILSWREEALSIVQPMISPV